MADMSLTADHPKEATNNNASCQPRVKWCDKLDKTTFIILLLGQFEMDREVTLSLPPNVFPGQNYTNKWVIHLRYTSLQISTSHWTFCPANLSF